MCVTLVGLGTARRVESSAVLADRGPLKEEGVSAAQSRLETEEEEADGGRIAKGEDQRK